MRPRAVLSFAATVLLSARVAGAQEPSPPAPSDVPAPPPPAATEQIDEDLPALFFDDARAKVTPAEEGVVRFQVHGEYELRVNRMQTLPLDVSDSVSLARPGTTSDSLGQNTWLNHWFRINAEQQFGKTVRIVGQMDLVTGLVMGDLAHDVSLDQTPRDADNGFSNVQPRWLYVEWLTPVGLVRAGQMGNHWGMGIVANDGDHRTLFGDYRYGSIGDGLLFGTKPLGKDGPLTVALGGQFVFKDALVDLSRGDRATQVVAAAYLEKGYDQIGIYGAYRHQWNNEQSDSPLYTYADQIDVGVVDVAGKVASRVPGEHGWVVGSAEVATIFGNTNEIRTQDQALSGARTNIASYGGAAQVGYVHVSHEEIREGATHGANGFVQPEKISPVDWGDFVAQIELGYASGDANPYGSTQKRFTFDPNHKVGLLLFDEVMRWQTARAASAAVDPNLSNGARPTPGVNLIPSNGAVFGAEYLYPTAIVRPRPWLDLKAGVVIAQATADVVDPYRTAIKGSSQNYLGGNPARHDLGVELDGGFEVRVPLDYGVRLALGSQAGVLFPGGALADANGNTMRTPWIAIGRIGVTF